ncbi:MAG: Gfo/Idh/MocA family oxidoreductase [Arachnia sp.]
MRSDSSGLRESIEAALPMPQGAPAVPIGLVGCGWIAGLQLQAYRHAGFNVVALADRHPDRAEEYRRRYAPHASVHGSLDGLLQHPGLGVVDIATHTSGRAAMVRQCINAGVAVLSQKPFVDDLEVGLELAREARAAGVTLAVNQNGRWAPHFAAMRAIVAAGIIGDIVSADFQVSWPHDLVVANMPVFREMDDLVLFDFGAHWFDMVATLAPAAGTLVVQAEVDRRPGQAIAAPMQADALVTGPAFRAALSFRAGERFAETGAYRVSGTAGVLTHVGRSLGGTEVRVHTGAGTAAVEISPDWFTHGLAGAMREVLDSVATGEVPDNSADSALKGLALCFAAVESARTGARVMVGEAKTR